MSSYLPGIEAGDSAAQYWADRVVNSEWYEDPTARAGLLFSVLWTDETAARTAFTLGTAGTGAIGSRAVDFLTKGYGFKIGRAEFWYKLPKINGRTYFPSDLKVELRLGSSGGIGGNKTSHGISRSISSCQERQINTGHGKGSKQNEKEVYLPSF